VTDRLAALRALLEKSPANALARFGLANELCKVGAFEEAVTHYAEYLAKYDDEGNGWGRYADALTQLGRLDEARVALRTGIAAADRHGHPGMVEDLESRLDAL
jgi:predicted Zn-dependent protease